MSMEFDEYQERASQFAVYPGKGVFLGLAYVALGVNGEAGEVAEKVKKAWRDEGVITPERRLAILKEVGDTLWYLSQTCEELNASLADVADQNLIKLQDRLDRDRLHGDGDER